MTPSYEPSPSRIRAEIVPKPRPDDPAERWYGCESLKELTPQERYEAEVEAEQHLLLDPRRPRPKVVLNGDDGRLTSAECGRFLRTMCGLAVGDALGAAVEFKPPDTFPRVTGMRGGGPFGLKAGQWTDDTSMALCLAESLVACKGFDPKDQINRYLRWYRHGHHSSTGRCFDIGNTTRAALEAFERTSAPFSGPTDPDTAGNGSLMRLAPVPLFFSRTPEKAMELAGESSRTTHGARVAVDACRYFAGLLVGCGLGASKEELLSVRYSPVPGYWETHPLCPEVDAVAQGSFRRKQAGDLPASGYVVDTLEAALWAFATTANFKGGCLKAVNLGNDADTTGAVYGQLAGAFYRDKESVPEEWANQLAPPLLDTLRSMTKPFAYAMPSGQETP